MKCRDCNGAGYSEYDGDRAPCSSCDGTGEVKFLNDTWDRLMVRLDLFKESVSYTKLGRRYWLAFGKRRKARSLIHEHTLMSLYDRQERSRERLRIFATHLETGLNIQNPYEREQRLQAETNLAIKMMTKGLTTAIQKIGGPE